MLWIPPSPWPPGIIGLGTNFRQGQISPHIKYNGAAVTGQCKKNSHETRQVSYDLLDASERFSENSKYDFSFRNPRLIERYLQEKLWILVHLRFRKINGECVACFQRESISQSRRSFGDNAFGAPSYQVVAQLPMEAGIDERDGRTSGHQKAVLIDNVEAMETPQGIIPSLVWLDSLDGIYSILPHAIYLSRKSSLLILGSRHTFADWETNILGRFGLRSDPDESARQVVQSASQVLNRVSSDQTEMNWNRSNFCDCVGSLSALRISLYESAIRVSFAEVDSGTHEIVDVLIGPLDL